MSLGYDDVIVGRLLLQGAVSAQGLWTALRQIKASSEPLGLLEALARGPLATLAGAQALEQARQRIHHIRRVEHERELARRLFVEQLVHETVLRSLFAEVERKGFQTSLSSRLVQERFLSTAGVAALSRKAEESLEERRLERVKRLTDCAEAISDAYTPEVGRSIELAFELAGSASGASARPASAPPAPAQAPAPPPPPPPAATKPTPTAPPKPAATDPLESASVRVPEIAPEDCPIYGYEIVTELGKGSMGVVYKARHIFTDRIVALKILPLRLAARSQNLERFKREAMALMKINHVNVVRAFDFGGSEEYYYLALEYIEGETLEEALDRQGRIPENEALDLVRQVALGLQCAADLGIVHRDIKPENVMLTRDGVAKICDFGIVKLQDHSEGGLTIAGTTVGTPFYISPEQARGQDDLDLRSDIYSLGVSLFHLATGQVPFTGNSQGAILVRHILEDVPDPRSVRPELSDALAGIIKRMCCKAPDDRYPDARELVSDIEKALGSGEDPPDE